MGMDIFGRAPFSEVGKYFRANVWSWRPIHQLCEQVLGQKFPSWAYNDGEGLETQAECDRLADRLMHFLDSFPQESIEIESDFRVDPQTGVFLGRDPTCQKGESAFSTTSDQVRRFVEFLRACGGFRIH